MALAKVMLIRHAEKPDEGGTILGVDEEGRHNPNELSVRGWQRAGALVRFFEPLAQGHRQGIATPAAIFACKPYGETASTRPFSTVLPLARALGLTVNHDFAKSAGVDLLEAVRAVSGPVLICWPHDPISDIVRGLAGDIPGLPPKWPGKRFDLVWILDRVADGWVFSQAGQMLLAGDAPPA